MEPTLGALKEWLLTPAPTVTGLDAPYLWAREVPPPLAFVLHLCHTWSPELVLALAAVGAFAGAGFLLWAGFTLLRSGYSLFLVLGQGWLRLQAAAASRHPQAEESTTATARERRLANAAASTAVLVADREARLRTLLASDSEAGPPRLPPTSTPDIPLYPSDRPDTQPRETRRRRTNRDPCLR